MGRIDAHARRNHETGVDPAQTACWCGERMVGVRSRRLPLIPGFLIAALVYLFFMRSYYFISDRSTSTTFSICRSCPLKKSDGELSTSTSGGTP